MSARKVTDTQGTDEPTPGEPTGGDPGVPAKIRGKYDPIWALVERFCRERLNDEYLGTCRRLLGVLARKRPSPLASGTPAGWAAGVVRAVGYVNFLDDKSRTPHVKTAEIDKAFGVSTATGAAKGKAIRDLLKMRPFDLDWTLPSHMADNPMAYLITVNGFILDARHAPPEVQREAVERGLIPPLPAKDPKPAAPPPVPRAAGPRLYTLRATIIPGRRGAFAKQSGKVKRTIEIRGDQTLADLHEALFTAFDRYDEHMYEFQFGLRPQDPANRRYVLPMALEDNFGFDDDRPAAAVDVTTLDSLRLRVGQTFGYWFDFGDDWWHRIDVLAIDDAVPPGTYPKVTARVGESPQQYPEAEE
jgi:hypothetical protein